MSTAQPKLEATVWKIDPVHSEIGFSARHMMVTTVRGRFHDFSAQVEFNEAEPARSKVSAEIEVASIDTRSPDRDNHLRSADFFDVENHPRMTFEARNIERAGQDRYRIAGDLSIRGVTRPVVLETEVTGRGKDPWGGERIGVTATTRIDRRDFGLQWNVALETGGFLVGDEIRINLELQLIRQ